MKFSIIITTHNASKGLTKTLDSVLEQECKDYEVIVIDGCSTDGTQDILKEYEKKFSGKLTWSSQADKGIYDAMNKGIDKAKGDWLYFLGSGDYLLDTNTLAKVADGIKKPDEVIYGNVKLGEKKTIHDGRFNAFKLVGKNICHQAIFYNRKVFEKLGKFETKYDVAADYVFNMKWFNDKNISKKYINQVIAYYDNEGFSAKIYDEIYWDERNELINKYFPWYIVCLRKIYTPLHKMVKKS
jgi:glycosyltransferase involved in cell wall biosynthesis